MKKVILLALMILTMSVIGYSITVQPGSNASGDSANTAATLVYRDTSGNFAAGAISAETSLILTMPAAETIAAAATITANACGGVKRITAASAVTTNTTDTFTAPAAANSGCVMDVVNVGANAITLDYNANFHAAGAANVVLGSSETVRVASTGSGGFWYQIGAKRTPSVTESNGNVGIGTSSPGTTLDVNGDATIRGNATITGSTTVQGILRVSPTANIVGDSVNPVVRLSDAAGTSIGYGSSSVTITAGVIQNIISAAEIARVNATGLGIKTDSPQTTLDVAGNAQFGTTAKSTFSTTGALTLANGAGLTVTGPLSATTVSSSMTVQSNLGVLGSLSAPSVSSSMTINNAILAVAPTSGSAWVYYKNDATLKAAAGWSSDFTAYTIYESGADQIRVKSGDLGIITQGKGLILRATDGANCHRLTVNAAGTISTATVTCL